MKKSKLVTIGGIMLVLGLCGYFFWELPERKR